MRYPDLVPDRVCKTPIELTIYAEHLSEDGEPEILKNLKVNCNYQDGGKAIYGPDHHRIEVSGRAYLNGDIAPEIANITAGEAVIFGQSRPIAKVVKGRNPDGTVNFTEVILK